MSAFFFKHLIQRSYKTATCMQTDVLKSKCLGMPAGRQTDILDTISKILLATCIQSRTPSSPHPPPHPADTADPVLIGGRRTISWLGTWPFKLGSRSSVVAHSNHTRHVRAETFVIKITRLFPCYLISINFENYAYYGYWFGMKTI